MGGGLAAAFWRPAHRRLFGAVSRALGLYMLTKYPHLVLFPVHPTTAARYRETFWPSGAKGDPSDTASLLDLLLRHRERLRPLQPDTVETRLLHFLVEERRQTVDEKTRQKQSSDRLFETVFPAGSALVRRCGQPPGGGSAGTLAELGATPAGASGHAAQVFSRAQLPYRGKIEERIAAIYQAVPATKDAAVLEAGALTAHGLVKLLETLRGNIAAFDKRIAELVADHPDGALFRSLPGAGDALVPRMIVAFGTQRDRYQSAYEMQCYSGIAPVKEASGKTEWVHFRFTCPKFLRQTFHEFAGHSIGQSEWARAYYDHLRNDKNKSHQVAVRSLAFKWLRIIYRCWKDGKPYDEQVYMQSLRRRGSLLAGVLGTPTGVGWKSVAGFQKFSENNA